MRRAHNNTLPGEFVEKYLEILKRRKFSRTTLVSRRHILNGFGAYVSGRGVKRIQDITVADLNAYRLELIERDSSSNTLNGYLGCVRSFFKFLEQKQHILINPAEQMIMPRLIRPLQPVPSQEEVKRLLDQPDVSSARGIRDRALLEVAYSTGARLAELAGMNLGDIDLKQCSVRVLGKGSKERVLPLGKAAMNWLRRYINEARPSLAKADGDKEALWLGDSLGRRYSIQILGIMVRNYGKAAGTTVPITPHSLRRACATHMLESGAHPAQIQMLLGHASLRALSQYLRVTITDLKKAHARTRPGQ